MSGTESSEDERPSFGGLGASVNRRKFVSGSHNSEDDPSPAKRMRFSRQSKAGKDENGTSYSKAGSFASRMMAQMGYKEGEGLGKEGKGRLAPIETQLRPQGAGLGAVKEKTKQAKEEEKREAAFRGETIEDSSEEEREKRKQQRAKRPGLPTTKSSQQKRKVVWRTAREIAADSKGLEVPDVLKTLVDVSGNKTDLLATNGTTAHDTEEAKISRRARRDLEAYAEDWRALQERKKFYDDEFQRHVSEIDYIQQRADNLEKMLSEIESIANKNWEKDPIDEIAESLELLETRLHLTGEGAFEEILKAASVDVQDIGVGALAPSFARIMAEWDPLEEHNPHKTADYLTAIKNFVGLQENMALVDVDGVPVLRKHKNGTAYDTLINTHWLPVVRKTISTRWEVENPDPITKIVELWTPLLPSFVNSVVMDQLIIPRLSNTVKRWRQGHKRDGEQNFVHVAPHVFLFPWLPLLPAEHLNPQGSNSILADVRRKFAQEIGRLDIKRQLPKWLEAWSHVNVFKSTLSALYTNHLVPRLAQYIDNVDYTPTHERRTEIDRHDKYPLMCMNDWHPVVGDTAMSHLLAAHFFPKLTKAAYTWLITQPNVHEVGNFMRYWQRGMHPNILRIPLVHAEWTKFFGMVKQAFDLGSRVASELPPPTEDRETGATPDSAIDIDDPELNESIEQSFKDIVEVWCEEYDLTFVPMHVAHSATGLPLHRITASTSGKGGVQVYLKGDVVWAQKEKGKFVPMELGDELAKLGGAKL